MLRECPGLAGCAAGRGPLRAPGIDSQKCNVHEPGVAVTAPGKGGQQMLSKEAACQLLEPAAGMIGSPNNDTSRGTCSESPRRW